MSCSTSSTPFALSSSPVRLPVPARAFKTPEAESRGMSDGASALSLVLCCPFLPSSTSPAAPFSSPSLAAPSNLNGDEPGGSSRTRRTRAESRARETARLRRLSCSAARSCPRPLAHCHVRPRPPAGPSRRPRSSTVTSLRAVCAGARERMHPRSTDASVRRWVIVRMHPSN